MAHRAASASSMHARRGPRRAYDRHRRHGPVMRELTLTDVERLQAEAGGSEVALEFDEDMFVAFYERTSRALWAYLARMTGSPQVADDLLQESYYRFLRARGTYESEAHRRNSLFRIATNLMR